MKSLGWIAVLAALVALVVFTEAEEAFFSRQLHLFDQLEIQEIFFLSAIVIALIARLFHAFLHRAYQTITVTQQTLSLTKGIIFRHSISIPMQKITEIKIGRDLRHLLFALCYLEIAVPSITNEYGKSSSLRLEGLTSTSALKIRSSISQAFNGPPFPSIANLELAAANRRAA